MHFKVHFLYVNMKYFYNTLVVIFEYYTKVEPANSDPVNPDRFGHFFKIKFEKRLDVRLDKNIENCTAEIYINLINLYFHRANIIRKNF